MANVIISQRWKARRGTAAALTAANEVLLEGEFCVETDTTWPGGGRKFKIGDGVTAWNSLTYAVPDASGGGGGDPASSLYFCEEFLQKFTTSTNIGTNFVSDSGVVVYLSNGTASVGGAVGRPAQLTLSTGANSSGYARAFVTGPPKIITGGGVIRFGANIRIPVLSTSGQRHLVLFGLLDNISGTPSNRIVAYCTDNVNSGQWVLDTFNAGTQVTSNSAVAPVADTETLVEIEVNAAGDSATLYIDGSSAATVAVAHNAVMTLGLVINKSVGTTARTVICDYMELSQTFTTPRG